MEYFDKLFGSDVVGQRPQALPGSAGKKNNIHDAILLCVKRLISISFPEDNCPSDRAAFLFPLN